MGSEGDDIPPSPLSHLSSLRPNKKLYLSLHLSLSTLLPPSISPQQALSLVREEENINKKKGI